MKQPIDYSAQLESSLGDCVDKTLAGNSDALVCIYQYKERIDTAAPDQTLRAAAADIRASMWLRGCSHVNPIVRPTSSGLDVNCLMGHKGLDSSLSDAVFTDPDIVGQIVQHALGSKQRWTLLASLWRQLNRLCCGLVTSSVRRCNLVYLQKHQHRHGDSIVTRCTSLEKLRITERDFDGDELVPLVLSVPSLRTLSFKCNYELSMPVLLLLTQLRALRLHAVSDYNFKLLHMTWLNSIKISACGDNGYHAHHYRHDAYLFEPERWKQMTNLTSLVIKHQHWAAPSSYGDALQHATNLRKLVLCTDPFSFPNGRADPLRLLTRLETLGMTYVTHKMWKSLFHRLPLLSQLDLRGTRGDTFRGDEPGSIYIGLYPVEKLTRLTNLTSIKFNELTFDAQWRCALREWVEIGAISSPPRPQLLEYTATGRLL